MHGPGGGERVLTAPPPARLVLTLQLLEPSRTPLAVVSFADNLVMALLGTVMLLR